MDNQPDVRMISTPTSKHAAQRLAEGWRAHAKPELSGRSACRSVGGLRYCRKTGQHSLGFCKDGRSSRSQHDTPSAPLKEGQSEVAFQCVDASRQRRWCHAQPFGGGIEAAVVRHRSEIFERYELHKRSIAISLIRGEIPLCLHTSGHYPSTDAAAFAINSATASGWDSIGTCEL